MDSLIKIIESKWFWFPIKPYIVDKSTGRINLKKALFGTISFGILSTLLIILILVLIFFPTFELMGEFIGMFWIITLTAAIAAFLFTVLLYGGAILILKMYYDKYQKA